MKDIEKALRRCDAKLDFFVRVKTVGSPYYHAANKERARLVCILAGESKRRQDDEVERMRELLLEGRVAAKRAVQDCARVVRLIEKEEQEKQERMRKLLFWVELGAAFLTGFTGVKRL